MIEAMACGTPVIAYRSGSVPEVIDHGITGFIVEDEAEAVKAIHQLDQLDRKRVREQFKARFTAERMAREYTEIYKTLLNGAAEKSSFATGLRPNSSAVLPAGLP